MEDDGSRYAGCLMIALLLLGCQGEPTQASWVRSFDVGWEYLNHRVSALTLLPGDQAIDFAFVGGVSTTATRFSEPGCESPTCEELPALDYGELTAELVTLSTDQGGLGHQRVTLEVGAEGATTDVTISVPGARRDAVAWIGGFAWWSGVPLASPSCYDPRHGWLPTTLTLEVMDAAVTAKDEVKATVRASFDAGLTLEEIRECLDAAAPGARMEMTVDVVAAADLPHTTGSVSSSASWPRDPSAQQVPPPAEGATLGPAAGWTKLDWRFHTLDTDGRGAYLRRIGASLDSDAGQAIGWATNASPTMLSGFDYAFSGAFVSLTDAAPAVRSVQIDEVDAAVDEGGRPIVTTVEAP